jgi:hypothetical protein
MDPHLPRSHVRWRPATVFATLAIAAAGLSGSVLDAATPVTTYPAWCASTLKPADTWNTLTVDLTVRRQHLTSTGETTGTPSPTASYRLERPSRTGGWKSKIIVSSIERPPTYSLSGALRPRNTFAVARIEDDEDGTPLRAYSPDGSLLQTIPVSSGSSPASVRTVGQQWLDAFVATPGKKTSRQQAFERLFGKATKVGGLNRYFRTVANGSQEVLVDPRTVVPVESNAMRAGREIGHRTFTYGAGPDSALVRTAVHADTVTTASTGERTVVDTTFSRICLERR